MDGEEEKVLLDKTTDLLTYTSLGIDKTKITKVEFGTKCTTISDSAFEGCTSLALTSLPPNVEVIGKNAFKGCTNITISEIPESCTTIGAGAFAGCSKITKIESKATNTLTMKDCAEKTGYNPQFANCTLLNTIILPAINFERDWNNNHFSGCENLTNVVLGSKENPVSMIGARAFSNCLRDDLKIKVYIASEKTQLDIEPWGAINATIEYYDATSGELTSIVLGKEYTGNTQITWNELPNADRIRKIGDSAFEGCTSLALTSLPPNVEEIGRNAFKGCAEITISEIPESCTTIGAGAFAGCSKITKIESKATNTLTMKDCLEKTGYNPQFANCTLLNTIILPAINFERDWNNNHFSGCENLTNVVLGSKENPVSMIGARAFSNCLRDDLKIKVYIASEKTQLDREPWGAINATIEYYDATTGNIK